MKDIRGKHVIRYRTVRMEAVDRVFAWQDAEIHLTVPGRPWWYSTYGRLAFGSTIAYSAGSLYDNNQEIKYGNRKIYWI
jgi:hypothetical protein